MVAVMEWYYGNREVSGEELAHYERLSEKRQPAELPVIEQPKRAIMSTLAWVEQRSQPTHTEGTTDA